MKYGELAGVVKPLSRLVLGTMVCSADDRPAANTLLDAFVGAGGTCIDTAHVYGGGKSERAIGAWMQDLGNRERIVVIGKGAHHDSSGPRVNPEAIAADLNESLERLQTDYIDLYLLHRDDVDKPVGPIVEALEAHRRSGRIHAYGGSNWSVERIQEANDWAQANGAAGFVANSPQYSFAAGSGEPIWPGCVTLDAAGAAWHEHTRIALFPWASQAMGFFTGRFTPDRCDNEAVRRSFYSEANWERFRRATELGALKGVTANNIGVAWLLHRPFPVFPLIGPHTVAELESSLPAIDVELTPSETEWLTSPP